MNLQLAEKIVECCNEIGIDASIYKEYSGRAMYNKTTTGVGLNASSAGLITALIACADMIAKVDEDIRNDTDIRIDSLGLGSIIY